MPRYFFHLFNDVEAQDLEGRDLPDDAAAHSAAVAEAREMMTEAVRQGALNLSHRIDVEDASGRRVLTVRYGDAVRIT